MRSRNMQRLTDQLKARYPGIVVYGIGDAAHKLSPSGHNEDDTPGSRPEREDADNIPEHRAIDAMHGASFTPAEGDRVTHALVTDPANRARLIYVIHRRTIWRAPGWAADTYGGDPHDDHVHASGHPNDDDNTAAWIIDPDHVVRPAPLGEEDDMKPILGRVLPSSTVWKGYGIPGSLMALHSPRAYTDLKSSLDAVELHYGGPNAGDAGTLVDVLGTLPREEGETEEECYARSVGAVEDAG